MAADSTATQRCCYRFARCACDSLASHITPLRLASSLQASCELQLARLFPASFSCACRFAEVGPQRSPLTFAMECALRDSQLGRVAGDRLDHNATIGASSEVVLPEYCTFRHSVHIVSLLEPNFRCMMQQGYGVATMQLVSVVLLAEAVR